MNRTPAANVEPLRSAVAQLKPVDSAVLRIERSSQSHYLAFRLE
jgi:hypothetical protein